MKYRPGESSTPRACELRRNPTDAEIAMWQLLRENFPEVRFRRQVALRGYYADFASHRAKLVIEVDGGQHEQAKDARRTELIDAEGYRVPRFWNNQVLGNPDGVWAAIDEALRDRHPHPSPPPSRGTVCGGAVS